MKTLRALSVALFTILLASCASPTTVGTTQVNPMALGIISVFPFNGYNGEQFSNEVEQQLMLRGAKLVDRARIISILAEQGLSVANITEGSVDFRKVGGLLGVDVVVTGSVSPIIVYATGVPSGKVSAASLRMISVQTGEILATASYSANTDLLAGSVLYPEAAKRLVTQITSK